MHENLVLALFVSLPCLCAWALRLFARRQRRQTTPSGWRQLVTGNALVLGFLLSLLLLGGEVYFRFFYDSTDAIGLSKVSQRWFQRYWRRNAINVRDNIEYPFRRTALKHRVTFVGDSFTAGHGIKDVNLRFVNLIRRAHPEWEVQMLAQPGLETGHELNMLKQALEHGYQLDEVVLVYYLNDISDLIPERDQATALVKAQIEQSGWLRRNSYCIDYFCSRWQASHNPYMRLYFVACAAAYGGGGRTLAAAAAAPQGLPRHRAG